MFLAAAALSCTPVDLGIAYPFPLENGPNLHS